MYHLQLALYRHKDSHFLDGKHCWFDVCKELRATDYLRDRVHQQILKKACNGAHYLHMIFEILLRSLTLLEKSIFFLPRLIKTTDLTTLNHSNHVNFVVEG